MRREIPTRFARRVAASPPAAGSLLVTSNVPGAQIYIDGRSQEPWVTPHRFSNLSPGVHQVMLSESGYDGFEQTVRIDPGIESFLQGALMAPTAGLDLSTVPPGAEVSIDGKSYGQSPVHATIVPGQHSYLIRKSGMQPVSEQFVVKDRAAVHRTVELIPVQIPEDFPNVQITTTPPQRHRVRRRRSYRREIQTLSSGPTAVHETLMRQ